MKSKRLILIVAASILFVGAIVVLRLQSNTSLSKTRIAPRAISVSVAEVVYGSVVNRIEVTGALEGEHEAEIVSETSGKIVKLNAEIDSYLPVNASVAVIENDLQEIALEQARCKKLRLR